MNVCMLVANPIVFDGRVIRRAHARRGWSSRHGDWRDRSQRFRPRAAKRHAVFSSGCDGIGKESGRDLFWAEVRCGRRAGESQGQPLPSVLAAFPFCGGSDGGDIGAGAFGDGATRALRRVPRQ